MNSVCADVKSKTRGQPTDCASQFVCGGKAKDRMLGQDPRFERMLLDHWPMIRIILGKMRHRLPIGADLEELHSAGLMGLIDAIHKFDDKRGYTFETYASFRVRGAIQDALRGMDWMSRSSRRKLKAVSAVSVELEQRLGRPATDGELQKELGLGQKAFRRMRAQTAGYEFVCLDAELKDVTGSSWHETVADERQVDSADELETRELLESMSALINALPYRLKKVVELYYFEGLRQHAIAARLGLSEARICQLRTEALELLRSAIEGN